MSNIAPLSRTRALRIDAACARLHALLGVLDDLPQPERVRPASSRLAGMARRCLGEVAVELRLPAPALDSTPWPTDLLTPTLTMLLEAKALLRQGLGARVAAEIKHAFPRSPERA